MTKTHVSTDKSSPLLILILYLFFSIFTGLIFSIFSLRAKSNGKIYAWWWILSLISAFIFGFIGYVFMSFSSVEVDVVYYYLGIITFSTNLISLVILFYTLIK